MLHRDPFIISKKTFELIQRLQSLSFLQDFILVGGTSLALQLGHRNSIDIDLFTINEFESRELIYHLEGHFSTLRVDHEGKRTLLSAIDNIKVDFISHPYQMLREPVREEGITMASMEDIAAMKMHAIVNSGQRLKDFIDIYFLLEHFSIKDMVQFYEAKYVHTNPLIAIKAITFFGDIDVSIDPPKMKKPIPLEKIKKRIHSAVDHSTKVFKA